MQYCRFWGPGVDRPALFWTVGRSRRSRSSRSIRRRRSRRRSRRISSRGKLACTSKAWQRKRRRCEVSQLSGEKEGVHKNQEKWKDFSIIKKRENVSIIKKGKIVSIIRRKGRMSQLSRTVKDATIVRGLTCYSVPWLALRL